MQPNQKAWLAWIILLLVTLAISLFFGIQYPIPDHPTDPPEVIELSTHFSGPLYTSDLILSGDLTVAGDATVTGATSWGCADTTYDNITATDTATADKVVITDTLTVGGESTFTDAVDITGALDVTGNTEITGTLTASGNTDIGGTLQYGADDLYPVGNEASGLELVTGTDDVTGTLQIDHGLTTVTWALCSMAQDAVADAATCSVAIATNDVTVKVWKADGFTAGSETDVTVNWLVIGAP